MDQIRIVFLGTSAGMPSRARNVASVAIAMDGRVLLFLAAVTILTSIGFGLAPALRAARLSPTEALRTV
jgi:ABC-type antimicrobial peptide transport system permease subunit